MHLHHLIQIIYQNVFCFYNKNVVSGLFCLMYLVWLYCLQICLMSRDEQSILVVSYTELKQCLEQSFEEILSAATKRDQIA